MNQEKRTKKQEDNEKLNYLKQNKWEYKYAYPFILIFGSFLLIPNHILTLCLCLI
jgi:hypothetical protein